MFEVLKKAIRLGISESDDEALKLKKISIAMVPFIIGPIGLVWGIIIFLLGDVFSAIFPLFYSFGSVITLLHFYKTKDIKLILYTQMSLILILPFFLLWSLGGFTQGSYIFIWAFFAPIIALIHIKTKASLYWLYAFIALVIFSVFIDSWLIETNDVVMPRSAQELFFFLNIVFALSAIYFLIKYFIDVKDKNADEQLKEQHDALLVKTQELEEMLYRDTLTGYKNRNALFRDMESGKQNAFLLINIDAFSEINSLYGEWFGNDVLICFSNFLNNFVLQYKNCSLYRLSGDEFVVISTTVDRSEVMSSADYLIKTIRETPFVVGNQTIFLNVTVGISFEETDDQLMSANMALKSARRENVNMLIYSDKLSLSDEYENNIKWIGEIKEAIKEDRIVMYFQPIVDNENPSAKKYETLVRLLKKDGSVISPFYFLEIAKKAKLYKEITKIVLRKSFEAFKDNKAEFSINITIDDIMDENINSYIIEIIEKYNISERVIFEIVESESIENFEEVERFITKIKSYGCRIAIDDFGTGYSNFEYLMRLQADFIKIDGSIIREITMDSRSALITSIIVAFAKELKIKTIGEYVESEEVQKKLLELGVNQSQGYYFDEPLPKIKD